MTRYLLDANVLIALTVAEHEHHERASMWAESIERFALCPIVEGALVRFLVRLGESAKAASAVVQAVHSMSGCEFWPDSVSYIDTDLSHVVGHQQVTDAYLAALSRERGAGLATMDEGLVRAAPDAATLVPS